MRRVVRISKRLTGSARSRSMTMPSPAPPRARTTSISSPTRAGSHWASAKPCPLSQQKRVWGGLPGNGPARTTPSASLFGYSKPSTAWSMSGVKLASNRSVSKSVTNQLVLTPASGAPRSSLTCTVTSGPPDRTAGSASETTPSAASTGGLLAGCRPCFTAPTSISPGGTFDIVYSPRSLVTAWVASMTSAAQPARQRADVRPRDGHELLAVRRAQEHAAAHHRALAQRQLDVRIRAGLDREGPGVREREARGGAGELVALARRQARDDEPAVAVGGRLVHAEVAGARCGEEMRVPVVEDHAHAAERSARGRPDRPDHAPAGPHVHRGRAAGSLAVDAHEHGLLG